MPTSTIPARRARFFSRCPLLLLVLLLAAGCRSSQSAYQFRPAPAPVAQRLAVPAPPAATTAETFSEATVAVEPTAKPPHANQPLKPKPRQARQQLRQALAQVRMAQPMLRRADKSAGQAVRATAGPRETAEVGLGTTVLGVLGLVVLPVALIGLLIWGGPVWAVLAGLAALAVLVAYLDPFG